ncbi:MAG: FliI/YscN family ATPase [Myxococcota bacterium]
MFESMKRAIRQADTYRYVGKITRVVGTTLEGDLPRARIGATCRIEPAGAPALMAEIVGLRGEQALLMPLGPIQGLTAGAPMVMTSDRSTVELGEECLGRVLDALGRPIDRKGELVHTHPYPVMSEAPKPLDRRPVHKPLDLGVRAVNGLLTIGEGQRIAIAAGAGVGKSTLLGMMARHTEADVAVIALVGERGREVQEFVDEELVGPRAGRIVVVASTSDEPAAMRLRAAFTATAIAEYFRDRGRRVLLMMDSLSRVVQAQREVGLSTGEVPATRGYPPSAFAVIPALLERAGQGPRGSITAIYTTLFDGGDDMDPVSDAVRATTDGHIVLSRDLAERGIYPAIDVPKSISRVMRQVTEAGHQRAAEGYRALLHDLQVAQDLASLGAYTAGANPQYDRAMELAPRLMGFLRQAPAEAASMEDAVGELTQLVQTKPSASNLRRPAAKPTPKPNAYAAAAE